MEPISTVLTGLALARQGIAFIKENLDSANDAKAIGQQLSAILMGHDEFNKERFAPKLGFGDVAGDMIEYKQQQEELYEIKKLLNLRFGSDFYASIIRERAARIEAEEERQAELRKAKAQRMKQMMDILMVGAITFGSLVILGLAGWIMYEATK